MSTFLSSLAVDPLLTSGADLTATLGWRPFLDPLPIHDTWYWFLIPMAFLISVVYRAARVRSMDDYWKGVAIMTVQIVLGMFALAIATYLFVMVYVRFIAERLAGG
jgi:hypothetical protein